MPQPSTPPVKPNTTPTPAPVNGSDSKQPTAPANIPKPKGGEDVDVDVRFRYLADGDSVVKPSDVPKLSAEQAAELAHRQSTRQTGKRVTELDEWLDYWREFGEAFGSESEATDVSRFKMSVMRLTDDIPLPNQPPRFLTLCTEDTPLGKWNFTTELNRFIGQLQTLNNNSGGRFRVTLIDGDGDYIRKEWYDARGNPLEGQQNATWIGSIANPQVAQSEKEKEKREKKEENVIDQLEKLAGIQNRLKAALGIKDEKEENSIAEQVQAAALPAFISNMISVATETTKAAFQNNNNNATDKGFFRSLAESDEGMKRIFGGLDNTVGLLSGLAADLLQGRAQARQQKYELEKLQMLKENPDLARALAAEEAAKQKQEKESKESVYDYICRMCEERNTEFDFATDAAINGKSETVQGLSNVEKAAVRGILLNEDLTPEDVLEKFINLCESKGKGERAKNLRELPQTIQFIQRMQRSVRGEPKQ